MGDASILAHPALSAACFQVRDGPTLSIAGSARPVTLELPDGTPLGGYWSAPLAPAPLLVVLPAGDGLAADHLPAWPRLARTLGLNLFLLDYPGLGSSGGEPSLAGARAAAHAALDYLLARPLEVVPWLVLLGRGLGGLLALELASAPPERLRGLVLESAIADLGSWLEGRLDAPPPELPAALAEAFPARRWLEALRFPCAIVQSFAGGAASPEHGELLEAWADPDGLTRLWLAGGEAELPELLARELPAYLEAWRPDLEDQELIRAEAARVRG